MIQCNTDAIVLGTGLLGSFVANMLAKNGFSVVVAGTNSIHASETAHAQGILHTGFVYSYYQDFAVLLWKSFKIWETEYSRFVHRPSTPFIHRFRTASKQATFRSSWSSFCQKVETDVPEDFGDRCYETGECTTFPMQVRNRLLDHPKISFIGEECALRDGRYVSNCGKFSVLAKAAIRITGRDKFANPKYRLSRIMTFVGKCTEGVGSIANYHIPDEFENEQSGKLNSLLVVSQQTEDQLIYLVQSTLAYGNPLPKFCAKKGCFLDSSSGLQSKISRGLASICSDATWKVIESDIAAPSRRIKRLEDLYSKSMSAGGKTLELSAYPVRLTLAPLLGKHLAAIASQFLDKSEFSNCDQLPSQEFDQPSEWARTCSIPFNPS
jgi:hypothetical protein